jgi:hypothetical protein
MRALKERLFEFLFPTDSDAWLSILRVGLGFQITLYSLSLRNDWNYLFAGADSGLIDRRLTEALLSRKPFRSEAGMARDSRSACWPS